MEPLSSSPLPHSSPPGFASPQAAPAASSAQVAAPNRPRRLITLSCGPLPSRPLFLALLFPLALVFPLLLAPLAPAAQGPGLPTQTWPAGTHLATMNDNGRAVVWHRGWLYIPGLDSGNQRTTVWDISNPTSPRLVTTKAGGSNVHDYWKVGDLFSRDYSMPELAPATGTQWLDMSQLPSVVAYTGAAPKPGLSLNDGINRWMFWPYTSAIESKNFNQMAGTSLGGRILIGNLLFLTPHDSQSGVASFDISDPDNPRLLDVLNPSSPIIRQYTTSKTVWRNHLIFAGGDSPNPSGGKGLGLVGVDYANPSDLRVSFMQPIDDPNFWEVSSRYIDFQDEFGFAGRFFRGWKVNMETRQKVLAWNPPSGDSFPDFYWLPVGHLVVGTGDGGKTWIYAHQSTRDTRPPSVGWHWPRPNAVNQHVKSRIGFIINETLDDTTLNAQNILVRPLGGSPVPGLIIASDGDVINFSPDVPLQANTTYEVVLPAGGIKDAAGNGIEQFSFRFSTGSSVVGTTAGATTGGATTGSASTGGASTGGSSTGGSSTTGGGTTGLPSPWLTADIGSVGSAGSVSHSGGTFTVEGSGSDIWAAADAFRFVYRGLSGDGEIRARITSQENTDVWAKAGVMIRESLAAGSKHAFMALTPGNGASFQRRPTTDGTSESTTGGAASAPLYLRLVRSGSTLTGYRSADGSTWTQVGSVTISMNASVQAGLAVTAHNNATLSTAVFDNVSLTQGSGSTTGGATTGASSTGGTGSTGGTTGTGTISREVWTSVGGSTVADIPLTSAPATTDTLTSLETPTNWADNYGTRIRGYLHPPVSGSYTFWVASDDASQLWLSTSSNPASKVKIAEVGTWTASREWNKLTSQKSTAISLTAGQRYYIEVLQKEGGGGDNLAVGWSRPTQATTAPSEVIPGSALSPWDGGSGTTTGGSSTGGSSTSGSSTSGSTTGIGTGLRGEYFNGDRTFAGTPVLVRTDATVDFSWGASPGTGVNADQFSVRWTGEVEPPATGNYTFQTESDDGIRLWVNNQLVIDNWTDHGATVDISPAIALTGGTKVPVRLEFYEATGGAVARLRWIAPGGGSTAAAIPQNRLYPASGSGTTTGGSSTGGSTGTASASMAFSPVSPVATGTSVTFTLAAQNHGSGLEYKWDLGNGTVVDWSSANASISRSFANPGNFTVVGQVRNSGGSILTVTEPILVYRAVTGSPRESSPIVVDAARRNVWVVNPDANTVTVLGADTMAKIAELPVGPFPSSVALDASGQIWVACRDDDTLHIFNAQTRAAIEVLELSHGAAPVSVVCNPAGDTVFVAESGKGRIQRFAAATRANTATLNIGPTPRALAVTADGGRLLVSRFISADSGATVWSVALPAFSSASAIGLANDTTSPEGSNSARGVRNYLAGLGINAADNAVWIASKKDNIFRGQFRDSNALTFETSVRAMLSSINLGTSAETSAARVDLDNLSQPAAITAAPLGNHLVVAIQGNNLLLVLDAYTRAEKARVETGLAPQGVAIDPNTKRVFVQNYMGRTVSVFSGATLLTEGTGSLPLLATVNTVATETLTAQVLAGKRLFYNAADPRMSRDGYISCAVCHLDGDTDGRVWDFTDRGEGLRNTASLRGQQGALNGRVHWSGNFDEIQDFEHDIRSAFAGTGFMANSAFNTGTRNTPLGDAKAGASADLDALAAYVNSLSSAKRSPQRTPTGELTADAQAGAALFAQLNCAQCHSGARFSDSALSVRHNVGTLKPSSGKRLGQTLDGIDTPILLGLFASAPYLHDGSAATVRDVLTTANPNGQHGNLAALSSAQIDQLAAFLLSIEEGTSNPGGPVAYNGEPGGRNLASSTHWHWPTDRAGGNGVIVSEGSAAAHSGTAGLILDGAWNFSVAGAYGFSVGLNFANWQAANTLAANPNGTLVFWIKASRAYPASGIRLKLRDVADVQTDEITVTEAQLPGGITTGWKEVRVPLSAFTPAAGFNWTQLAEIDVTIGASPWGQNDSIIVHIDDIHF